MTADGSTPVAHWLRAAEVRSRRGAGAPPRLLARGGVEARWRRSAGRATRSRPHADGYALAGVPTASAPPSWHRTSPARGVTCTGSRGSTRPSAWRASWHATARRRHHRIAERQTAGRGRLGRQWHSPAGPQPLLPRSSSARRSPPPGCRDRVGRAAPRWRRRSPRRPGCAPAHQVAERRPRSTAARSPASSPRWMPRWSGSTTSSPASVST